MFFQQKHKIYVPPFYNDKDPLLKILPDEDREKSSFLIKS